MKVKNLINLRSLAVSRMLENLELLNLYNSAAGPYAIFIPLSIDDRLTKFWLLPLALLFVLEEESESRGLGMEVSSLLLFSESSSKFKILYLLASLLKRNN